METTTLPAVKVLDKHELGQRKIKALLREKLSLPGDAPVNLLNVTWSSHPTMDGLYEHHENVTVDYSL
ncbi:hypothetical protein E1281_02655 [Actinomadura sp. KC345]|uniref:hypothetical protein n=1 Tax=Actinomadura sp. KC345 TaxID=2530371 RepID=UPI001053A304|nr:hypothetical protein [Actinomadura sp. KC345]TDC58100.1 hypothetical protein E1281_02655 [Actinomadura sp. KC345]